MNYEQLEGRIAKRQEEDKEFQRIFVDMYEEGYIHTEVDLEFGKRYMIERMDDVNEITSSFYDDEFTLEETLALLRKTLKEVYVIRERYFGAKEHAIENGIEYEG